jgi:hypothetical protein
MSIETLSLVMIFLRGDLHRDGAQRYAHHLLYGNEDEREPRPAHALEFSEKKYDAALVLPQHAKRANEIEDYCNTENVGPVHGVSIWLSEQPRLQNEDMQNAGADDATRAGSVRTLIA